MSNLMQDLRFTFRGLCKSPGFTAAAVLSLALGIGANTAIFSLTDALLLQPMPHLSQVDELVAVYATEDDKIRQVSYGDYLDFEKGVGGFSSLAAFAAAEASLTHDGPSERISVQAVSPNYFQTLGVEALQGSFADIADDRRADLVVVGHNLWQRSFGSHPALIGQSITINGRSLIVAAIAPEGFSGSDRISSPELWLSIRAYSEIATGPLSQLGSLKDRRQGWLTLVGRRHEGASLEQVKGELGSLAVQLEKDHPETHHDRGVQALPLIHGAFGAGKRPQVVRFTSLQLLMTGIVLLIACLNVAGLILARGLTRQQELAIRLSLGATRRRLLRLFVTESLLLTLFGGLLGIGLAATCLPILEGLPLPVDSFFQLRINSRLLGFAIALSMLCGLLLGCIPALRSSRKYLVPALKQQTKRIGKLRIRDLMVTLQLALSLVILIASLLFVSTLNHLETTDPGFDPNNILIAALDLEAAGYGKTEVVPFYEKLMKHLATVPGVESASMAAALPIVGADLLVHLTLEVEGFVTEEGKPATAAHSLIGRGFFRTIGTPIARGREFSAMDTASSPGAIVINRTMAEAYWPDRDPIGRQVQLFNSPAPFEVIGIVEDSKHASLRQGPQPTLYLLHSQAEQSFVGGLIAPSMTLLIRVAKQPRRILPAIRQVVHWLDPHLPVFAVDTLSEHLSAGVNLERGAAMIASLFALLALALTIVGVYGVASHETLRRIRETAVRMALGASPSSVLLAGLAKGLRLALVGTVLGLGAAALASRFIASRLFGVTPTDPGTYLFASLAVVAVTIVTVSLPAHRAANLDPGPVLQKE